MSYEPTKAQKQALNYDGLGTSNLLISASAGTGKTTVLINRLTERLLAGKVKPEGLLIMTFTDAAVGKMRTDLEQSIKQKLKESTDEAEQKRLRELRRKFPLIQICSIHSFCLSVIREFSGQLVDATGKTLFDANFNVLEDVRAQLQKEQCIKQVLEQLYADLAHKKYSDHQVGNLPTYLLDLPTANSPVLTQILSERLFTPEEMAELNLDTIDSDNWLHRFEQMTFVFNPKGRQDEFVDRFDRHRSFLRSLADYRAYLRYSIKFLATMSSDFTQSSVAENYYQQLQEEVVIAKQTYYNLSEHAFLAEADAKSRQKKPVKEAEKLVDAWAAFGPWLKELTVILAKPKAERWDLLVEAGKKLVMMPRLRADNKNPESDRSTFREQLARGIFPLLQFFVDIGSWKEDFDLNNPTVFVRTSAEIASDQNEMNNILLVYFEALLAFDRLFQQEKIADNTLDFNDFEHYAKQLLQKPEIAERLRQRYQEIYVDEYQDTNDVQEFIIERFAHNNVFMVGDVKQSIYRFRHANPNLFKHKLDHYQTLLEEFTDAPKTGNKIYFGENFRCDELIVELTNSLFNLVMTEKHGDINYQQEHQLIFAKGGGVKPKTSYKPELLVVIDDRPSAENTQNSLLELAQVPKEPEQEEDLDLVALEAKAVSAKIKQLVLTGQYNFGDVMILASTHQQLETYAKEFEKQNIPALRSKGRRFGESREIQVLSAAFNLLDNFCQDIPLVTVMRSELLGEPFVESELLNIALFSKDKFFHQKLLRLAYASQQEKMDNLRAFEKAIDAETKTEDFWQEIKHYLGKSDCVDLATINPNLKDKVHRFVQLVWNWRAQNWLNLSELLAAVLEQNDYKRYLANLPTAHGRLQDVELFEQWITEYSQSKGSTLHEFITYLKRIAENGQKDEELLLPATDQNVVRLMTIHASKGLQAKVVFLVACAKDNLSKIVKAEDVHLTTCELEDGAPGGISNFIIAKLNDTEYVRYNTPWHFWHLEQSAKADRAERLRLLYVAMTRAEQQLYMVAAYQPEKLKKKLETVDVDVRSENKLDRTRILAKTKSYADLFFFWLAQNQQEAFTYFYKGTPEELPKERQHQYLHCQLWGRAEISALENANKEQEAQATLTPLSRDAIRNIEVQLPSELEQLIRPLPEDPLKDVPSKVTVSELKKLAYLETEGASLAEQQGPIELSLELKKSEDLSDSSLAGTSFGTFIHQLVQQLDLRLFVDIPKEQGEAVYWQWVAELIEQRRLDADEERLTVAWELLEKYIYSELASRVCKAEIAMRELPFTMPVAPIGIAELTDDVTLVQGIIDLWFVEDDQVVLVDFKSDRVPENQQEATFFAQRYQAQLEYYAQALELSLGKKVKAKIIWALRSGKQYELGESDEQSPEHTH